jgi:hypothetical protein
VKNIFLICPVRNADPQVHDLIKIYVEELERRGDKVHWPARDTNQNDSTGGYQICKTNFEAIFEANEVHIWYDESSNGSKFDMGGVFMLHILGLKKRVVIANRTQAVIKDDNTKSFLKVLKRIADK